MKKDWGKKMRPVYVCQLPDEMQREIRGILTRLLLYQCETEEKAEEFFDMSLTDAVQLGMDSKIVDIDCVADSFKSGGCFDEEVPEDIRKHVERLAEIICMRIDMETDSPLLYHAKEQIGGREYYELVNVLWRYGEDDYSLWQVQLPVWQVRNILNSPQNFTGGSDEIMDDIPVEQGRSGNMVHFLFLRGGKIACCNMEMEEKFFEEYSNYGTSVRGSRADIRQDLAVILEVYETISNEEVKEEMER